MTVQPISGLMIAGDQATLDSHSADFPIVGVGASAGGLKALISLFSKIQDDIGVAFVVIQHLDPHHESQLVTLLARHSRLPVLEAVDQTVVLVNNVYVITPNTRISIDHGILRVTARETGPQSHLVIDSFFGALARSYRERAIGIILSGTGTDGTRGLAAIRGQNGHTIAQDGTAEYPGMPQSAIGRGCVDAVLDPDDIAAHVSAYVRSIPRSGDQLPVDQAADFPDIDFEGGLTSPPALIDDPVNYNLIIGMLHAATGTDFTHYRSTTITRRTMRRMTMAGKTSMGDYVEYLESSPAEVAALARDVLIHVTRFYRDEAVFENITKTVFSQLLHERTGDLPLRLWIVGCSTGQEVYSLAIDLVEYLSSHAVEIRVQIFATDISEWALQKARQGSYPASIVKEIPAHLLNRYFTHEGTGYRVKKVIRDLCVFAKHDITADTPFSRIDLISCRNVLIYLGPPLQKTVLPTFRFALNPGGFLILGTSESLGQSADLFEIHDEKNRIYRAGKSSDRLRPLAVLPPRSGDLTMPLTPPVLAPAVSEMQRAADQIILGRFSPAGVLITDQMEIIQFRGQTNTFLQPAQGDASLDLLSMVPFSVAEVLRAALSEARLSGLPATRSHVVHSRGLTFQEIKFEVLPIILPSNATCFLILFAEQNADPLELKIPVQANPHVEPFSLERQSAQLRLELTAATNYVQSLVALNRTLAEELKDAREEAQSGNEEFRSTNEELQTAKEEVESTNQELITINDELRAVNEDLAKTSTALGNLGMLTAAIVETVDYPLLVLNDDLRVETANQAFYNEFHVERSDTLGRLVYDLGDGQWNIPELRRLLNDILPNNSVFDNFEVVHDFGLIGKKTMLLNAKRLQTSDLRARLIVLAITDITERSRELHALQTTAEEQLRSNAELDQFAAIASHDLQEPLRTITNYIDLLQRRCGGIFDDRARQYMAHVTDGATRMSEMIEAVLAYARLDQDHPVLSNVDSALALHHALESLTAKIEDTQATIIAEALPQVTANREQLTRIFQNLISNSLKFRSKERQPTIRINAIESPDEWCFSVTDNGLGMERNSFGKIFELFHREHTKHDIAGCGIGLATCKKIIDLHHGRIWVDSQLDVGSTFTFSLPKTVG